MDDLISLADAIGALLSKFKESGIAGLILPTDEAADFQGMVLVVRSLIDDIPGTPNDFGPKIVALARSGDGDFVVGPSYAAVRETVAVIRTAASVAKRRTGGATGEAALQRARWSPRRTSACPASVQPARRNVRLYLIDPISRCEPAASTSMPWKARRDAPPHTTTSPCASLTRRGRSLRWEPLQRKVAGSSNDTDTMRTRGEAP